MADLGEGPGGGGGGGAPLIFRLTELETAPPYVRIWMTAPPLSKDLDDRPPPLSQGLDPALVVGGMLFLPPWLFRYKGVGCTRAESHCTLFLTLCSFLREAVARNGI